MPPSKSKSSRNAGKRRSVNPKPKKNHVASGRKKPPTSKSTSGNRKSKKNLAHPNTHNSTTTAASTSENLPAPKNTLSSSPPRNAKNSESELTTAEKIHAFKALEIRRTGSLVEAFNWQMKNIEEFFDEKQFRSDEEAHLFGETIGLVGEMVQSYLIDLRTTTLTDFIQGKNSDLPHQLKKLNLEYGKMEKWSLKLGQQMARKLGLEMSQVIEFHEMIKKIKRIKPVDQTKAVKLFEAELKHGMPSAYRIYQLTEKTNLPKSYIKDWFKEKLGKLEEDLENGAEVVEELVEAKQEPQEFEQDEEDVRGDWLREEQEDVYYGEQKMEQDFEEWEQPLNQNYQDDAYEQEEFGRQIQEEQGLVVQKEEEDLHFYLHLWSNRNPDPTFSQIQAIAKKCNIEEHRVFQFLQDRAL